MKRVLLVNKFYYARGGDCVYTINLERLLKENGHEVAVFAIQHPENLPSEWSGYFPTEVDYTSGKKTNIRQSLSRPFGDKEVSEKFNQLLNDFKPDIVHLNNIHTQLSPVVAEIASKRGIKLIWTLHDYKLLCPRSDCLRQGIYVCEKCYTSKINVVKYRCTKGSISASILAYLEALKWNRKKLSGYTSCFICPSNFMKQKMSSGHFLAQKMVVLNNFIGIQQREMTNYSKSDYCCYIGRLSKEKGIETLLKVMSRLPYRIKIIGSGPLENKLKKQYTASNIEFLGFQNWETIKIILEKALFSVIPSECYDNNPLSVIESLCLGTPVLGAQMGGIPELIQEGVNGSLFESGNENDLEEKLITLFSGTNAPTDYQAIAETAYNRFSAQSHYNELINIYEKIY